MIELSKNRLKIIALIPSNYKNKKLTKMTNFIAPELTIIVF